MCKYSTRVIHTLDVVINGEEAEKEAAEISVNSDDGSCHHSELLFTMIYYIVINVIIKNRHSQYHDHCMNHMCVSLCHSMPLCMACEQVVVATSKKLHRELPMQCKGSRSSHVMDIQYQILLRLSGF